MGAGLAICLMSFTWVASSSGAATAQGPEVEPYSYRGSFDDTDLCGFPLHISWRSDGTRYRWFDADGDLQRFVQHGVWHEVVRANGKVAIGVDREKVVEHADGSLVVTGSWIFFLPDGTHIQNAGRLELSSEGDTLSDHGPHPIQEGRLAELFCPPMA
jgi:hypothetical protein